VAPRPDREVEGRAVRTERIAGPAGAIAVDDGGPTSAAAKGAVVLVHSLAGNIDQWSGQLAHLRKTRHAVALDLRGHGRSGQPADGDFAMASLAADVGAVADALGLDRFALVGHSLGAGVALTYAGAHAARVERLLLADAIGDGTQIPASEMEPFLAALDSPNYAATIEEYWASISGSDPAVRERLLRDLRATPRGTVVAAMRAVAAFDPKPALARWQGPTLAVIGERNNYPFSLHRIGRGLPHTRMEGTGHWLQLDRPAEFNRILDGFLEA
jgi:pimeloyl-ACP methyl ester carboxylesterase